MSKRNFVSGLSGNRGTYNVRESELFEARVRRENSRNQISFTVKKPLKCIRCQVYFLDSTQHTFEIDKRSKGEALLESVFQHLELIEKDYFGLQFVECHNHSLHNQRHNTVSSLSSANSSNCCSESFYCFDVLRNFAAIDAAICIVLFLLRNCMSIKSDLMMFALLAAMVRHKKID
ncbi:Tyrosine-protein phosphatase non-receptor type 4-like protein [Leptotrombidium deliense]|uniref:Tyrosine-protein phosphatase non-receptor type 4-like protein n=1 Tax=Leptotrombidium deliense TaxID=299467 RepID=A0A443STU2_9ACAR|nr:Tyrosine-protein phosphatase non-receptor type 4-like protein [Leptotrombidium deliense]